MSTALEYAVDASGRVSTASVYREITQAQWEALPLAGRRCWSRYGPALRAVADGKIIALPAPHKKRAWNIQRAVQVAAKSRRMQIEMRQVADPDVPGGVLVLVREQQRADGVGD